MHHLFFILFKELCTTFRYTPFATGPNDDMEQILTRIETGTLDMSAGNWKHVSVSAKVCERLCCIIQNLIKMSKLAKDF